MQFHNLDVSNNFRDLKLLSRSSNHLHIPLLLEFAVTVQAASVDMFITAAFPCVQVRSNDTQTFVWACRMNHEQTISIHRDSTCWDNYMYRLFSGSCDGQFFTLSFTLSSSLFHVERVKLNGWNWQDLDRGTRTAMGSEENLTLRASTLGLSERGVNTGNVSLS